MTAPMPLTPEQQTLPTVLPRHLRRRIQITETGCWIATGSASHGPYQSVSINNCSVLVHRFVYEVLVGPIPAGLTIDHLCRVKWCCNPAHLEPVTIRVNVLRSDGTSAVNARRTRCKHGHPLSGDNLYVRPDGKGRQCIACQRRRERAHAAKRRGEG